MSSWAISIYHWDCSRPTTIKEEIVEWATKEAGEIRGDFTCLLSGPHGSGGGGVGRVHRRHYAVAVQCVFVLEEVDDGSGFVAVADVGFRSINVSTTGRT